MEETQPADLVDDELAEETEEQMAEEANTALLESIFDSSNLDDEVAAEFGDIVELVDNSGDPVYTAVTVLDDNAICAVPGADIDTPLT